MTMIKADVFERITQEKLKGTGKLVNLAVDLGSLPNGIQNGETHRFMKWKHISEPVLLVKGQPINTEELQNTDTFETVKHIAKGVEIYDYDKLTVVDGQSMEDIASKQIATVFTRALEKDLGAKLLNAPLKFKTMEKDSIKANEIDGAMATAFGDEQDAEDFAGIVINSMLSPSFYSMPEFVDVNKTYNSGADNGKVKNGVIGFYRSIPVMMSDVTTIDKNEPVTFILKKGAFGYKKERSLNTEVERNAKYKKDEIYADMLFVTGLVDDSKIVVLRNTIA